MPAEMVIVEMLHSVGFVERIMEMNLKLINLYIDSVLLGSGGEKEAQDVIKQFDEYTTKSYNSKWLNLEEIEGDEKKKK